jgi:hypothetical protein
VGTVIESLFSGSVLTGSTICGTIGAAGGAGSETVKIFKDNTETREIIAIASLLRRTKLKNCPINEATSKAARR